jgi:hypothetical protein
MQFLNPSKEAAHDIDPLLSLFSTLRPLPVQRPQPLESPILSPATCLFGIAGPSDGAAFFSADVGTKLLSSGRWHAHATSVSANELFPHA